MERLRPHYPSPNLSTSKDRTHEYVCRKRCSLPPACAMTVHRDKTELSSLARLLCGFSDPREDRESKMQTGSDEGVIVHLCLKKLPERKGGGGQEPSVPSRIGSCSHRHHHESSGGYLPLRHVESMVKLRPR